MTNTSYYKNYRKEMMLLLPEQYSKVLEVGCGEGNFRKNLSQENEYWGVEPIEPSARKAAEKLDKVLGGTFNEMFDQIPDDYFDLVICNDVIEHMTDHEDFFQSIKKKIKKEGCLVASIPNVRYILNLIELLVRKDWEYKDSGILDRTHLRFFTEKSLKRTIIDSGFEIDQFKGINIYRSGGVKRYFFNVVFMLLGQDARYMQFGIRIK
jgi:2-polyprenyl-3-methyl-5-hydroxy-6-metoxy-1,4-benzoquinol methylase